MNSDATESGQEREWQLWRCDNCGATFETLPGAYEGVASLVCICGYTQERVVEGADDDPRQGADDGR